MISRKNILFTVLALGLLFFPGSGRASVPVRPDLPDLPVFFEASGDGEKEEARHLRQRLGAAPGLVMVDDRARAVAEIRVTDGAAGEGARVVARPGPGSTFLDWNAFDAPQTPAGLELFLDNLQIVRRLQGLDRKHGAPASASVRLSLYEPGIRVDAGHSGGDDHVRVEGRMWRLSRTLPVSDYVRLSGDDGKVALVSASNNGPEGLYVYGVNITEGGKILVFLPGNTVGRADHSAAYLAPGRTKMFDAFSLILTEHTEGVHVVFSPEPLDLSRMESDGFNTSLSASGALPRDDVQGSW